MSIKGWLELVEKLAPIALAATPLAPIAPFVVVGVQMAEQIPGATGAQKLEIAKQVVSVGVQATNIQAGHQEIDPVIMNKLVERGIGTVVEVVNLVHSTKLEDEIEK